MSLAHSCGVWGCLKSQRRAEGRRGRGARLENSPKNRGYPLVRVKVFEIAKIVRGRMLGLLGWPD